MKCKDCIFRGFVAVFFLISSIFLIVKSGMNFALGEIFLGVASTLLFVVTFATIPLLYNDNYYANDHTYDLNMRWYE